MSFEKEFEKVWSVYCKNAPIRFSGDKDKLEDIARHFANWQKEQMIKNSVECTVSVDAGGYPYIGNIELYDYENDKPLAKAGDKVKVIINN